MQRCLFLLLAVLLWSTGVFAQSPRIGPSITDELTAAGVAGLPFAWNSQTGQVRTDDPQLTAAQRTAILAVFAAHDPTKLSSAQQTEQVKIKARTDLIAHCAVVEADTTIPVKVRTLCALLKQWLP